VITDTIRSGLAESGLTQNQIAEASGISQRAVSEFLRGSGVRSETLDRFAELLGVEISLPKKLSKNIRKRIKVVDA
jgi:transcriptional regulator with XRE-family HTH domain